MIYTTEKLIKVAKRENNLKRKFLYVNPLQGKHIPVSPTESLALFSELSKQLSKEYKNERLLIIGFAETATAIGSAISYYNPNVVAFLTTTREEVENANYIYFTESHSHATEQKLITNDLDKWLPNVDRIIFTEDEVTTGNTIAKLISALKISFPNNSIHFGIASLLNSMSEDVINSFLDQDIKCTFLTKIPFGFKVNDIENYYYKHCSNDCILTNDYAINEIEMFFNWNQRVINGIDLIRKDCNKFLKDLKQSFLELDAEQRILVIGTEEFMFPGMLLGQEFENEGHTVMYHATTRSPIEVSDQEEYPLYERYSLFSLYNPERITYIYNLEKFDKVFIVTDSLYINDKGIESILGALIKCGNRDITLLKWSSIKQNEE